MHLVNHVNSWLKKWCHWKPLNQWWNVILLLLSVYVNIDLVVKYWPIVGACGYLDHSKLRQLCCLAFSLAVATTYLSNPTNPNSLSIPPTPSLFWSEIRAHLKNYLITPEIQLADITTACYFTLPWLMSWTTRYMCVCISYILLQGWYCCYYMRPRLSVITMILSE